MAHGEATVTAAGTGTDDTGNGDSDRETETDEAASASWAMLERCAELAPKLIGFNSGDADGPEATRVDEAEANEEWNTAEVALKAGELATDGLTEDAGVMAGEDACVESASSLTSTTGPINTSMPSTVCDTDHKKPNTINTHTYTSGYRNDPYIARAGQG